MNKTALINYILLILLFANCSEKIPVSDHIRKPVDSVGFATRPEQVVAYIKKLEQEFGSQLNDINNALGITNETNWKTIIAPHDDYAYVQYLYPAGLKNLKAKTIFIFGVAHKAKLMNLEDKIIFDSFESCDAPFGKVKVSDIRYDLIASLDRSYYLLSDSMQGMEHSVEPFLPIVQYYHNDFQIVSILIPYMPIDIMKKIASQLANSIYSIAEKKHLAWGKDYAILISTDAVHYGDQDWGENNYSFYGADTAGYIKAKNHEKEIIDNCLLNGLSVGKIEKFVDYTVQGADYKEYKWTWCGRYSVPFGLLTTLYLQDLYKIRLKDNFIGYSTSIEYPPLDTAGLNMGFTAPANIHHWVGYACVAYE